MSGEVQGQNQRWNQAWLTNDAETVESLMMEDYIYIAPNGLVLDRQSILGIIRSPSYRLDRASLSNVVVRAIGHEAAVVRHRCQAVGSFEGTAFSDDHQCVMVWEQQDGRWKVVMEQHSLSNK